MGSPQACVYHKHSSSCHHVLIHAAHAASGHAALGVAGVLALVVNFLPLSWGGPAAVKTLVNMEQLLVTAPFFRHPCNICHRH